MNLGGGGSKEAKCDIFYVMQFSLLTLGSLGMV